jgi:hypothetical protein
MSPRPGLVGGAITIWKNMKTSRLLWLYNYYFLVNSLVGGIPSYPSEKYVSQWVSDDILYMKWKIIQPCLKPPTSNGGPSMSFPCRV